MAFHPDRLILEVIPRGTRAFLARPERDEIVSLDGGK
jgi:hypothetical protein